MPDLSTEQVLADAISKHGLASLKDVPSQHELLSLIRYARHIGFTEGYLDCKESLKK